MEDNNIIEMLDNIPDEVKKETLNKAISLMKILFKDPLIEFGNMFTERIKAKRYTTMINIIADAQQKLLNAGISPSEPSLKVILPLLESSSLEEDHNLKNKWSSLLKNALDNNKVSDPHIAYINILKDLTPTEGLVLDFLFTNFDGEGFDVFHASSLLEQELNIESDVFYMYLDNFQRMNLVKSAFDREAFAYLKNSKYEIDNIRDGHYEIMEIKNNYNFNVSITEMVYTKLCYGFMDACR